MTQRAAGGGSGSDGLDDLVESMLGPCNLAGVALAITDRTRTLWISAYGPADVISGRSLSVSELFEIGSISKSFTAVALMQQQDAGRLSVDDRVDRHLPWFPCATEGEPVTLHHLLTHTSGLVKGAEATTEARTEILALADAQPAASPGGFFHYSNVGYKALGVVLEQLTGTSIGELIRVGILEPLGMEASDPTITHATRARMATGHEAFFDDRPLPPNGRLVPATWMETATADGNIASTAEDMARYLRMLLNGGRSDDGRQILSPAAYSAVTNPWVAAAEPPEHVSGYGYGLNVRPAGGRTLLDHSGGMVGYSAQIVADPRAGLGVVVLSNGPGNPGPIGFHALAVARARQDGDPYPPAPPEANPWTVADAAAYEGTFSAGEGALRVRAEADRLVVRLDGEWLPLARHGRDAFLIPHEDYARFALEFERLDGRVVAAFHGADRYLLQGEPRAEAGSEPGPASWDALVGHYRSHNPWFTNFRVLLRPGALTLVAPGGVEAPEGGQQLVPLEDGSFRMGRDPRLPERLRFRGRIDGVAHVAELSGGVYARTFTP